MNFLEVRELTIILPESKEVLLYDTSLSIDEGEIVTIVGPTGSGKSTLLKTLAGYVKEDSFKVEGIIKRNVFTVRIPQEPYSRLLFNDVSSLIKNYEEDKGKEYLNLLNLEHLFARKINTLSYGEKKILSILTALLSPAQLILLDEPFSGLDDNKREKLRNLLIGESKKGRAFIIVDHTGTNMGGKLLYIDMYTKKLSDKKKNKIRKEFIFNKESGNILLKGEEISHPRIVKKINFSLKEGEILFFTGTNGSGKTTLLNILAGWEKNEEGGIKFKNESWLKLKDRRGKLFYISQFPESSFPAITLGKIIKMMNINVDQIKKAGLGDRLNVPATNLSFGEKIKVNLIMADHCGCSIIMIDEVFSSLDHKTLETMYKFLVKWQDENRGVILTSPNKIFNNREINLNG